jgi:SpoVK/Ycf46/Vps4 family AAA+-type ATPase
MTQGNVQNVPLSAPTAWELNFGSYALAGYQIILVQTSEESRVREEIKRFCKRRHFNLYDWNSVVGMTTAYADGLQIKLEIPANTQDPLTTLRWMTSSQMRLEKGIFMLRDFDDCYAPGTQAQVRRFLQNIAEDRLMSNMDEKTGVARFRPIVIVTANAVLPDKLKPHVAVIDYQLPTEAELRNIVTTVLTGASRMMPAFTPQAIDAIVRCVAGLTSAETENAFARSLSTHGENIPKIVAMLKREKAQIIKKSDVLTFIDEETVGQTDDIGGFEALHEWIANRKGCYSREAAAAGLDYPKGISIVGPMGTAKSVAGKLVAKMLGLPCYMLDIGALFGSLVGQSEQRVRDAIKVIEAQNGCVVLIDEIDKALGGIHQGQGDSGVGKRVLQALLTWLAEKTSPTFVIATMNRVEDLPPELLRAGRFDAMFCTDLPDDEARKQIIQIHLRKRKCTSSIEMLDRVSSAWPQLIAATAEFVGAEIESMIVEARSVAWTTRNNDPNPTLEELVDAASAVVPIARQFPEAMVAMRTWRTESKARSVAKQPVVQTGTRRRSIGAN